MPPAPPPPPQPALVRALVATLVAVVALAACAADERPTFVDEPGGQVGDPVGDAAVDAVLELLEATPSAPVTADYTLVRRLGEVATSATVADDGAGRRAVTIGDVRFVLDRDVTCRLEDGSCTDGIDEAATSDTGFASRFADLVPARRLRIAHGRRAAEPVASFESIAGMPATCVAIDVGTGTEQYCAVDADGIGGVVARWVAADVLVELDDIREGVDPASLRTTG